MKYNTIRRSITIPFPPFIIFHQFEYSLKDIRITIQEKCVKHSNMIINVNNTCGRVVQVTRYGLIASYNNRVESCFLWVIDSTDSVVQGMLGKSWGTWIQRLQWSSISAFFRTNFLNGWKILQLWVCAVEAYNVLIS